MSDTDPIPPLEDSPPEGSAVPVRSLKELIDRVTGRALEMGMPQEDSGIADVVPFPYLAIVGQPEMKLALLLAMINPLVGGVLLIGPRGTGKTTAVRSLTELLPQTPRSLCYYGCLPEDIENGGIDAVCPDCAKKYAEEEPLSVLDRVHLVELPLNARLDDVVGGLDERAALQGQIRLRKGILAQADRNLLYVDEVNLLVDEVVDAILDAAAQGYYLVRRGPMSSAYRARFVLVGSMNPEEGRLRPQIMDRFGLRVVVRGLDDRQERLEAYQRTQAFLRNPRRVSAEFSPNTALAQEEIQAARDLLPQVEIPDEIAQIGLKLIERLQIDSLRAEITLFEAARAHAVADGRMRVTLNDMHAVSAMALRMRRSNYIDDFFSQYEVDEQELGKILDDFIPDANAEE
jgi:magnesium chelatase subunit I